MNSYNLIVPQLIVPHKKADLERQFIEERIDILKLRLRDLNGDDHRRALLTIDYNQRLLNNPQATVNINANACR